jgi:thiol-disulfide isomerase/thioredoxin
MKSLYTLLFALIGFSAIGQYDIDIKLKNYEGDTVIIGNYYADKQMVRDTITGNNGEFVYEGSDTIKPGVYFVLLPEDNNFMQFFLDGKDHEFDMTWDIKKGSDVSFKGSKDNVAFSKYMKFIAEKRPLADKIRARMTAADTTGVKDESAEKELNKIDEDVKAKQKEIVADIPESISARFIKSSFQVDIPEFEGEDARFKTYRFYKQHYFDHIDLGDQVNLRTPYLHQRVDYYLEKLTPQDPDSIKVSIDYLLDKMEPAKDTWKYYLSYFLNKYAKLKIVGYDAVYVHLIDKYYATGRADWISEETLTKMKDQADKFRNILIGEKFPDITTYKADSLKTPVRLWDIDSDYTIVLFWAHDCGHCTKSMPAIVEFYDEYESKGVTLLSICTKGSKKTKPCQEAVPKKNMDKFINTFDEYQRYRRIVAIPSTPKIFILDKDKNILIKDIPAKDLKNIMPEIIKIDKEKNPSKI